MRGGQHNHSGKVMRAGFKVKLGVMEEKKGAVVCAERKADWG